MSGDESKIPGIAPRIYKHSSFAQTRSTNILALGLRAGCLLLMVCFWSSQLVHFFFKCQVGNGPAATLVVCAQASCCLLFPFIPPAVRLPWHFDRSRRFNANSTTCACTIFVCLVSFRVSTKLCDHVLPWRCVLWNRKLIM